MTIKEKLHANIDSIEDLTVLNQLLEILKVLNIDISHPKGNKDAILKLVGCLNDEDAADILRITDSEFNKIEGDWD